MKGGQLTTKLKAQKNWEGITRKLFNFFSKYFPTFYLYYRQRSVKTYVWSDDDIVKGCVKNDSRAQQELYQRLAPKMLAICYRYCNDRDDAKDVMHEAFMKVFTNIKKFKFNSTLETWITRIMINSSIDFFKKKTKTSTLFDNMKDEEDYDAEYEVEDPEDKVSEEKLLQLVDELPKGSRVVFNLYAIEGYGHKDIAQMLGISEGTSKSQLSRARDLLKRALKEQRLIG